MGERACVMKYHVPNAMPVTAAASASERRNGMRILNLQVLAGLLFANTACTRRSSKNGSGARTGMAPSNRFTFRSCR